MNRPMGWILGILMFAVVLAGCDSNDNEAQELSNGFMSARVEGDAWRATLSVTAIRTGSGVFGLSGVAADGSTIAIGGLLQTGEQRIGVGTSSPANASYSEPGPATPLWVANTGSGNGSVTIREVDDEHIAGTFSVTLEASPSTPATGSRTLTEGEFDIRFTFVQ